MNVCFGSMREREREREREERVRGKESSSSRNKQATQTQQRQRSKERTGVRKMMLSGVGSDRESEEGARCFPAVREADPTRFQRGG
jgi:hypothetical protein